MNIQWKTFVRQDEIFLLYSLFPLCSIRLSQSFCFLEDIFTDYMLFWQRYGILRLYLFLFTIFMLWLNFFFSIVLGLRSLSYQWRSHEVETELSQGFAISNKITVAPEIMFYALVFRCLARFLCNFIVTEGWMEQVCWDWTIRNLLEVLFKTCLVPRLRP